MQPPKLSRPSRRQQFSSQFTSTKPLILCDRIQQIQQLLRQQLTKENRQPVTKDDIHKLCMDYFKSQRVELNLKTDKECKEGFEKKMNTALSRQQRKRKRKEKEWVDVEQRKAFIIDLSKPPQTPTEVSLCVSTFHHTPVCLDVNHVNKCLKVSQTQAIATT